MIINTKPHIFFSGQAISTVSTSNTSDTEEKSGNSLTSIVFLWYILIPPPSLALKLS